VSYFESTTHWYLQRIQAAGVDDAVNREGWQENNNNNGVEP